MAQKHICHCSEETFLLNQSFGAKRESLSAVGRYWCSFGRPTKNLIGHSRIFLELYFFPAVCEENNLAVSGKNPRNDFQTQFGAFLLFNEREFCFPQIAISQSYFKFLEAGKIAGTQ